MHNSGFSNSVTGAVTAPVTPQSNSLNPSPSPSRKNISILRSNSKPQLSSEKDQRPFFGRSMSAQQKSKKVKNSNKIRTIPTVTVWDGDSVRVSKNEDAV